MILSPAQLRDLAASVGFPDPAMAAAVAMVESYGHTDASNIVTPAMAAAQTASDPKHPVGPERSFGIWQINTLASPQYNETSLLDPDYNARAAYILSNGGTNWGPWRTTIQSGAYRQYLPAGYAPPTVAPPAYVPPETVTPPSKPDGASGALVAVGVLALSAAAGFAVYQGRRGRRAEPEPEPEPFVYP